MNKPGYAFNIGDRVRYCEDSKLNGTIIGLTTLSNIVDGDCDDEEADSPWYTIQWDSIAAGAENHCSAEFYDSCIGAESEGMLLLLPSLV